MNSENADVDEFNFKELPKKELIKYQVICPECGDITETFQSYRTYKKCFDCLQARRKRYTDLKAKKD